VGVFVVYIGFIELTRFLPSPASRPEFGPSMRQILIGLLIILMLKFRPEGIFRERPGVDGKPGRAARLPDPPGARATAVPLLTSPARGTPAGGSPARGTPAHEGQAAEEGSPE
jgi:hypothetical protein